MGENASPPEWYRHTLGLGAARSLVEVEYEPGEVMMAAASPGDEFLIVVEGRCRIVERQTVSGVHHPLGIDGPEIAQVGPYALVGEIGLLTRNVHRHDVIAMHPDTALRGDPQPFAELLEDHTLAEMIGSTAARRLAEQVVPIVATTEKGRSTMLRPMLPIDRPDYIQKLATASAETILNRFFSRARPTPRVVERLLNIDFVHQFVWVAVDPDDLTKTWGEGRYVIDQRHESTVELALAVDEDQRGTGLGYLLGGAVAASAAAVGFEKLSVYVLSENVAMRKVLDKANAHWRRFEPGVVTTTVAPRDLAEALVPELIEPIDLATHDLIHAAEIALS